MLWLIEVGADTDIKDKVNSFQIVIIISISHHSLSFFLFFLALKQVMGIRKKPLEGKNHRKKSIFYKRSIILDAKHTEIL